MAVINQVITLGIGTPAGIKEFLTFGLQLGIAADSLGHILITCISLTPSVIGDTDLTPLINLDIEL